jgi:hypothetical protein
MRCGKGIQHTAWDYALPISVVKHILRQEHLKILTASAGSASRRPWETGYFMVGAMLNRTTDFC